jgi:hypothetical protein
MAEDADRLAARYDAEKTRWQRTVFAVALSAWLVLAVAFVCVARIEWIFAATSLLPVVAATYLAWTGGSRWVSGASWDSEHLVLYRRLGRPMGFPWSGIDRLQVVLPLPGMRESRARNVRVAHLFVKGQRRAYWIPMTWEPDAYAFLDAVRAHSQLVDVMYPEDSRQR